MRVNTICLLFLSSIASFLALEAVNIQQANASNHFGMRWSFYQYNDPQNKGRHTSRFDVGVPETDNRIASGTCSAGSSGSFSTLLLFTNIGNRVEGSTLGVEFFTPQGPIFMDGSVVEANFDEGFSGVALTIENNDPIWRFLADLSFMSYRVSGDDYELPLRGSGNAIRQFLQACNFYANSFVQNPVQPQPQPQPVPQPVPVPQPERFDPRWATCDTFANRASINTNVPVTVTFINNAEGYRSVMWIGYDGMPKHYADLDPGQKYTINTSVDHPWMFTDGPGNCLEMFMPQVGIETFYITAPNRNFGPE